MIRGSRIVGLLATLAIVPALATAQINFEKDKYYVGMGDSVAAGEGAMPVTGGYVYQLYDRGVFGRKQQMDFGNISLRGARSWELRDDQVGQALCARPALRPTVVTITAGANDFLGGDLDILAIAMRVADAVSLLLNNFSPFGAPPVVDPATGLPCPPLSNVTILVSNYYSVPHPDPLVFGQLEAALQGFDQALRFVLGVVPVPPGSRLAYVDLYTPSLGRTGLTTIDRRLGYSGPFDFDIHPTNLGHTFIAREFEEAWKALP